MAEVKGRFIQLACTLMAAYPNAQKKANDCILEATGVEFSALGPDEWYSTLLFKEVMELYAQASLSGRLALVTLGKKVYPAIKRAGGIPTSIHTPLDLIRFEAEGFLQNHRGADVIPRKILHAKDHEVEIEAKAPGYDDKLYEGVYLGILEMSGISTGTVTNQGNSTFKITW